MMVHFDRYLTGRCWQVLICDVNSVHTASAVNSVGSYMAIKSIGFILVEDSIILDRETQVKHGKLHLNSVLHRVAI